MAQAKIVPLSSGLKKIMGKVSSVQDVPYPALFDSKSGVTIRPLKNNQTYIEVPTGATLTTLALWQAKGYFKVVEGTVMDREAELEAATYDALAGTLTISFTGPVNTSALAAKVAGGATDDIRISTGSGDTLQYYAATFAAVSNAESIVADVDIPYAGDIEVEITAIGAQKILDAHNTVVPAASATIDMGVELLEASFDDADNLLTLTFSDEIRNVELAATTSEDEDVDDVIIRCGDMVYAATFAANTGTAQVESFAITNRATADGIITVRVTGACFADTYKDFAVSVLSTDDSTTKVATKVKAALSADLELIHATNGYTVGGTGGTITLTAKTNRANDSTLAVALQSAGGTGVTETGPTAVEGLVGTAQRVSVSFDHAATATGIPVFRVTAAGMTGSPILVGVAVTSGDATTSIYSKVLGEFGANANIVAFFNIDGGGSSFYMEPKVKTANDDTMNVELVDADGTGITIAVTHPTAGVAPIKQKMTYTITHEAEYAGIVSMAVTAAALTNSTKTVPVTVAQGDTAAQVATKIAAALTADADVGVFFTATADQAYVALEANAAVANDTTYAAVLTDGAAGVTADASANTTAGHWGSTTITSTVDIGFNDDIEVQLTAVGAAKVLDEASVAVPEKTVTIVYTEA